MVRDPRHRIGILKAAISVDNKESRCDVINNASARKIFVFMVCDFFWQSPTTQAH
jgi:hypothetical protein